MKTLFEFTLQKIDKIKKPVVEMVNGESKEVLKEFEDKKDFVFAIKKPKRSDFDEGDLFYHSQFSSAMSNGVMSQHQIRKRILEDGGYLSDVEKNEIEDLTAELNSIGEKLKPFINKKDSDLSKEELGKRNKCLDRIGEIQLKLNDFQNTQSSLYDNSAETFARNKCIFWWTLNLAYSKSGEDYERLFDAENHKDRTKKYDEMEESEDEFRQRVFSTFMRYISFWYAGKANTQKEFEELQKFFDRKEDELVEETPVEEVAKVEDVPSPE